MPHCAVLPADCTFSHVSGNRSPLLLFDRSSALLHRSAFHDCHITRQSLVDVSFASAARWRFVSLANTTAAGAAGAGAGAAADALADTSYFDYVTYATDDATGETVPEAADPETAVGGLGGAVVSRAPAAVAGAYDYLVEDAIFDDDFPFGGPDGTTEYEESDWAAGAEGGRGRGWGGVGSGAGGGRRLAQVEAVAAEVDAVAFLSPQDPWLVAIREVCAPYAWLSQLNTVCRSVVRRVPPASVC